MKKRLNLILGNTKLLLSSMLGLLSVVGMITRSTRPKTTQPTGVFQILAQHGQVNEKEAGRGTECREF